tara:strand:+ start:673 stop:1425 length:753 start_codon:yes stop_codon:yes gene_type:complete
MSKKTSKRWLTFVDFVFLFRRKRFCKTLFNRPVHNPRHDNNNITTKYTCAGVHIFLRKSSIILIHEKKIEAFKWCYMSITYLHIMHVHIPAELVSHICDYGYSLSYRTLNKKYHKQKTKELQDKYPTKFAQINYLKTMKIHANLNALRNYFPPKKDYSQCNTWEKYAFQQCDGYTEKGTRCKRRCKFSLVKQQRKSCKYVFCHNHAYYGNKLLYNDAPPSMIHYARKQHSASFKKREKSPKRLPKRLVWE